MTPRFQLMLGDLTAMDTEALVNSTDCTLLGGGPVHAAVHGAAGEELRTACAALGGCPVGEARITRGYRLQARYVIHTVAPTWQDGAHGEEQLLTACYRSSLRLAAERGLRSLAFPSIGSGRQPQIPLERAAPVAVGTILSFLEAHPVPEKVVLVCFDAPTYQAHKRALREALP